MRRWFQQRESPYPWKQDGLDHVKGLMPGVEPYRAWTTFSFVALPGRVHKCDLFIATPGRLCLVESKEYPGRAVDNGATWTFPATNGHARSAMRMPHPPAVGSPPNCASKGSPMTPADAASPAWDGVGTVPVPASRS